MIILCRRFIVFSLVAILAGVSGCSMLRLGQRQSTAPPQPAMPAAAPAHVDTESIQVPGVAPNEATVAAIEEFLERTREYAKPEGSTGPAPRAMDLSHPAGPTHSVDWDDMPGARTVAERVPASALPRVEVSAAVPAPLQDMGSLASATSRPNDMAPALLPWQRPSLAREPTSPAPVAPLRPTRAPSPQRTMFAGTPATNARVPVQPATPSAPSAPLALPVLQSLSVRAGGPHEASAAPTAGVSNAPVEVSLEPRKATWQALIQDLEADTEGKTDIDSAWRLGLARLAAHRGAPAALPKDGLMNDARLLFDALFAAASSIRDLVTDPVATGENALRVVDTLRERVADRSDPVVRNISLCRRVTTFGVFETMSPVDIVAGRATQTIVYSEIDNLRARQREDGQYETRLATRVEVLTTDGTSVWEQEEPEIIDRCRRRRRDFFLAQRVTFPATLPAGSYALKVMVEDLETGRTDEAIEPFVISSALSLAGHTGR